MSEKKNIVLDVIDVDGRMQAILPEASIHAEKVGTVDSSPAMTPAPAPREVDEGYPWAPWGSSDRLPTDIRQKIEKVPMAGFAIYRLVQMMFGNGIAYYRNSDLVDGPKVRRAYIPAVERFLRDNRINTSFLPAQFADYRLLMNSFCEMIFSNDRREVVRVYHKPAEHCRLAKHDQQLARSKYLLFSPDFGLGYGSGIDYGRVRGIPLLPWWDQDNYLARFRGYKIAWHSRFETPGIFYYARPWWIGLFRKNGWIDASVAVPEVVNSMMRNQVRLKYQILIPESYFRIRHQNWDSYTDDERNKIIDTLIATLNNALSGTKNAYTSIVTVFKQNEVTGDAFGKIEILAVDDKLKKDAWVPSSEKADAQIVQGLGLHPSQVGLAPEGGKMGAGSGSDQRESFNTGITVNTIDQDIVLEPLNWIAQYNARNNPDWDITFFIDHTHHTTTNNQETGLATSETTIELT